MATWRVPAQERLAAETLQLETRAAKAAGQATAADLEAMSALQAELQGAKKRQLYAEGQLEDAQEMNVNNGRYYVQEIEAARMRVAAETLRADTAEAAVEQLHAGFQRRLNEALVQQKVRAGACVPPPSPVLRWSCGLCKPAYPSKHVVLYMHCAVAGWRDRACQGLPKLTGSLHACAQANTEMETRMLEEQLEHARKDIVALKRKQEFQLGSGGLNPAALHAGVVCPPAACLRWWSPHADAP